MNVRYLTNTNHAFLAPCFLLLVACSGDGSLNGSNNGDSTSTSSSSEDSTGSNSESGAATVTPGIDTVPPTIAIIGANPASIVQGATYVDPGATAADNVDGDLTDTIVRSGEVDSSVAGAYTLTYRVADAVGNMATATRMVDVDAVVLGSGGCFEEGERPPSTSPSGFMIPDLEAERAAYTRFGWTWPEGAEPSHASPQPDVNVSNPNIHGDTEGDELWSNMMMYERTGQQGYLDRATAWRRYFVEDYLNCEGPANFCSDRNSYGADHLWGWGLVSWYQRFGDEDALAVAVSIAEEVEALWGEDTVFGCLPTSGCMGTGQRQIGRHLLLITRVAEVTGDARWESLRDRILAQVRNGWDETYGMGMYFYGRWSTNVQFEDEDAYDAGHRIASPFEIGVISEALDHAYRVTGEPWIRDRIVAIARFVEEYGLDPEYSYTGSRFGIVNGEVYHNYSAGPGPASFWDPGMTTTLVNTLVRGYRYTCELHFHETAREFFIRGNGGIYGQPIERAVADDVVDHFVDSTFFSSGVYFGLVDGELQYTYLLFEDI